MNGTKVLVVEEFCQSLDHAFVRADHSVLEVQMVISENHSGEMEELCSLWIQTWWVASASCCNCMSRNDSCSLIGITTAINGMETQFSELLVEVGGKKRDDG